MPSRFLGFLMKGRDLDMPSAAIILTAELDRTTDAGMNALMHDRTAKAQANRNMFLFQKEVEDKVTWCWISWERNRQPLREWSWMDYLPEVLKICIGGDVQVSDNCIAVWWFPYLFNERTRRSKREEEHTWGRFEFSDHIFLASICFTWKKSCGDFGSSFEIEGGLIVGRFLHVHPRTPFLCAKPEQNYCFWPKSVISRVIKNPGDSYRVCRIKQWGVMWIAKIVFWLH